MNWRMNVSWRGFWAYPWCASRGIASRLIIALAAGTTAAAATEPVSLELLLAVDVSTSVNDIEFIQQMEGMSQAFADREVVELILNHKSGVAVRVALWAGFPSSKMPHPWRVLRSEQDISAFASSLLEIPRENLGHLTALGSAMSFAIKEIETNGFEGIEKKIDVSGDGRNNVGPHPGHAQVRALAGDITINGLVIGNAEQGLEDYFERNVMTGRDAFVEYAANFEDFAEAFRRKLKRELSPELAGGPNIHYYAGLPR